MPELADVEIKQSRNMHLTSIISVQGQQSDFQEQVRGREASIQFREHEGRADAERSPLGTVDHELLRLLEEQEPRPEPSFWNRTIRRLSRQTSWP